MSAKHRINNDATSNFVSLVIHAIFCSFGPKVFVSVMSSWYITFLFCLSELVGKNLVGLRWKHFCGFSAKCDGFWCETQYFLQQFSVRIIALQSSILWVVVAVISHHQTIEMAEMLYKHNDFKICKTICEKKKMRSKNNSFTMKYHQQISDFRTSMQLKLNALSWCCLVRVVLANNWTRLPIQFEIRVWFLPFYIFILERASKRVR